MKNRVAFRWGITVCHGQVTAGSLGLRTMGKVSCPAGVLLVSSAGLVVIKLLQERNEQKKTTNLQSILILKQKRKIKEVRMHQ